MQYVDYASGGLICSLGEYRVSEQVKRVCVSTGTVCFSTYLVALECFFNRDDVMGFVLPGAATHHTDRSLVILTEELQLLLVLFTLRIVQPHFPYTLHHVTQQQAGLQAPVLKRLPTLRT